VTVLDPVAAARARVAVAMAERVAGVDMSALWVVALLEVAAELGSVLASPAAALTATAETDEVAEATEWAVEQAARVLGRPVDFGGRCALVDLAEAVHAREGLESGAADPLTVVDDARPGAVEAALLQVERDELDALWRLGRGGEAA
jgi:hypothetical protein